MNLYIMRHGLTRMNKEKKLNGQIDEDILEEGIVDAEEARKIVKELPIDIIYCSPLLRAKHTCEIVNVNNVPVIYDKRLMELYKGSLEGVYHKPEYSLFKEPLEKLKKYNVESKYHFFNRVKEFYDEILSLYDDKNILIVSHSGTIKMSMFYFNPPTVNINDVWYSINVKNCECYKFENVTISNVNPIITKYEVDKVKYPNI